MPDCPRRVSLEKKAGSWVGDGGEVVDTISVRGQKCKRVIFCGANITSAPFLTGTCERH